MCSLAELPLEELPLAELPLAEISEKMVSEIWREGTLRVKGETLAWGLLQLGVHSPQALL